MSSFLSTIIHGHNLAFQTDYAIKYASQLSETMVFDYKPFLFDSKIQVINTKEHVTFLAREINILQNSGKWVKNFTMTITMTIGVCGALYGAFQFIKAIYNNRNTATNSGTKLTVKKTNKDISKPVVFMIITTLFILTISTIMLGDKWEKQNMCACLIQRAVHLSRNA